MDITTVDVLDARLLGDLGALLVACVESGASIGFVLPLAPGEVDAYWREVAAAVASGAQVLLVAHEAGELVGTVQLALAQKANARHRAEVQRLLVPPKRRRQGLGRKLMKAAEEAALARDRSLLVWDTIVGDAGDHLYTKMGYARAGTIPAYAMSSDGKKLEPTVYFYALLGASEAAAPPVVSPLSPPVVVSPVAAPPVVTAEDEAAGAFRFSGSIARYGRSEPLQIVIDEPVPGEGDTWACIVTAETLGLSGMRVLGTDARNAAELALDLVKQSTDGNEVRDIAGSVVDLATWSPRLR